MEDLEIKIEDEGLWIEDRHSRFEDLITPTFDTLISVHPWSLTTLF